MANDVTLSKGVRTNLLSLQNTAEMMAKVQERLSTGKKVNSALDNPVNFFTAAGLNSRAGDLGTLLDAIGNGVQTLAAADKGITAITKLVESAKSTIKQAVIAPEAIYNYDSTITGTGALANDAAVAAVAAGDLTVTVNGTTETITFGGASMDTLAELTAALGGLTGVTGTIDANDFVSLAWTTDDAVTIGGDAAVLTDLGLTAGPVAPTVDPSDPVATANTTRASLQADFNELLNQITQLAQDASFNGVNLLNSDNLTVTFNEDGSSSLVIDGVDFTAIGLGLTALTGDGLQVPANVTAALAQLDGATAALRAQASAFGSNLSIVQARQDFTKNLINVLEIGADNLTLADTNEEGANLLALQTRQSLSTTSLSMAAQADQNVLRLFQ
jgi:flagellin-like hook-associated protein FlgL